MYKKYIILAMCLALAITLFHAPDSYGKMRAKNDFRGIYWMKIDEIEGQPWEYAAIINESEYGRHRDMLVVFVFGFSFAAVSSNLIMFELQSRSDNANRLNIDSFIPDVARTDYVPRTDGRAIFDRQRYR